MGDNRGPIYKRFLLPIETEARIVVYSRYNGFCNGNTQSVAERHSGKDS